MLSSSVEGAGGQRSLDSLGESNKVMKLFLPNEIFKEILTWLPVKHLVRCKCVCKQWCKMIEDRSFTLKHLSRCKPVTVICEEIVGYLEVDGIIVEEKFKKRDLFSGLVLEQGVISNKYRLRNFATREILHLPDPHEDTFIVNIADFNSSDELKLVSAYGDKSRRHVKGLEILNLDRDDEWRPLELPLLEKCKKGERVIAGVITRHVNFYYVKLENEDGSNAHIDVCSLHIESESFYNNTLPRGIFSDLSKLFSVDWNGRIAFSETVEEKLNVVVLEDHEKQKWSERKIVIPLPFMKENPETKKFVPCHLHGPSSLYFRSTGKDACIRFIYDIQLKKITKQDFTGSRRKVLTSCASAVTFKRSAINRRLIQACKPEVGIQGKPVTAVSDDGGEEGKQ